MTPLEAAAAAAELTARLERLAAMDLQPREHSEAIAVELQECQDVLALLTATVADAQSEHLAFRCAVSA